MSLTIAAVSDTHGLQPELPYADVLIHAGDASLRKGTIEEWAPQIQWLGKQPHPRKIYVPGNHDRYAFDNKRESVDFCAKYGISMLVDQLIVVMDKDNNGYSFWGSPWTPVYGSTLAYMHVAEAAEKHWMHNAKYADVWITHGPPNGILDQCPMPIGCPFLLNAVRQWQPPLHVFGHCHDRHGVQQKKTWNNTRLSTLFANVAWCKPKTAEGRGMIGSDDPIFTCTLDYDRRGQLVII